MVSQKHALHLIEVLLKSAYNTVGAPAVGMLILGSSYATAAGKARVYHAITTPDFIANMFRHVSNKSTQTMTKKRINDDAFKLAALRLCNQHIK